MSRYLRILPFPQPVLKPIGVGPGATEVPLLDPRGATNYRPIDPNYPVKEEGLTDFYSRMPLDNFVEPPFPFDRALPPQGGLKEAPVFNQGGGGYPMGGGPMGSGGPQSGAVMTPPNVRDMGGHQPGTPAWYRAPFYPTAPFYSSNPDVGYQTRFYSGGISGVAANTATQVAIQFDLPCRLIALNGSAFTTNGTAITSGYAPNDLWLFQLQYSNGDLLHTAPRLASTVVGSAQRPGEIGGAGWTIDQGASVILNITPLIANLRIDVTLVCLEMRGRSNFHR